MKLCRQACALALALSLPLAFVAPAFADAEPTVDQVYQAASAGRLADADKMIEQVLHNHPNSAKAHFVKAELAARESNAAVARAELAKAEAIAPGLPFAKPEAVLALRDEVSSGRVQRPLPRSDDRLAAPAPQRQLPIAWLAIAFAVVAAGIFMFVRRRSPPAAMPADGLYAGAGPGGAPLASGPSYAPGPAQAAPGGYGPAYPNGGYPQPAQPGMGSTLGHGLATGLAVGAGMIAAQEIGHRLLDHPGRPISPPSGPLPENERRMFDNNVNPDMGGQDFGLNDASSWDSGGGTDQGASDWDNS